MEAKASTRRKLHLSFHFERQRLNELFMQAIKYPLVLICAGAGYGKTTAVHDFVHEYQAATVWIQLSERDNVGSRFWENFIHTMIKVNPAFAKAINKIGFPDTADKLNQYHTILREYAVKKRRIIVFDDCHLIENPAVIRFIESTFLNMPVGTSFFIISRSTPRINLAGLVSKGHIFNISEDELRFTENELSQYLRQLEIFTQPGNEYPMETLREIMQDTGGWAFAINLIARSFQKAPAYTGYLRTAMKTNIFRFMETEIWDGISARLQLFLIQLSLIDHLSVDIITLLTGTDTALTDELERQNAYVRRDSYINAYLIHPLFLEFLTTKQRLLSQEQKHKTYSIAADWCNKNGFKLDALSYYEKTGDYEAIVSIFFELPTQIPLDIARYAKDIFDKIPEEAFERINFLAVIHIRTIMGLGLLNEAFKLAESYEAKILKLPDENPNKGYTLGGIYYYWGILRIQMSVTEDRYDFDEYFAKLEECMSKSSIKNIRVSNPPAFLWVNPVGVSRKGAPLEGIDSASRSVHHLSACFNGLSTGIDDLTRGELKFYQGDIFGAETLLNNVLTKTRIHFNKGFEFAHRALLYTMRIAVFQGDHQKAEKALKETKMQLDEVDYSNRFFNYDISLGWYYYMMDSLKMIPGWIQENFSSYGHASFNENFGNQIKARYHYMTRNYPPLLSYIQEMRKRESYLYGRVEMLAIEACIHYKMKDKKKACSVLTEAYETAAPNDLLMPFIELGKDIRTLTAYVLKERIPKYNVPGKWLEHINRKAASYAKHHGHIIAKYRQASGISNDFSISPREKDILTDLSRGLSRTEIAANRNLSINTVKMVINNVYSKLGAESLADAIRVAIERNII